MSAVIITPICIGCGEELDVGNIHRENDEYIMYINPCKGCQEYFITNYKEYREKE